MAPLAVILPTLILFERWIWERNQRLPSAPTVMLLGRERPIVLNVPVVETVKVRWLRKFDTAGDPREIQLGAGEVGEDPLLSEERPDVGCNIELTSVATGGTTWWTFGAESFAFGQPGQTTALVHKGLQRRAFPVVRQSTCGEPDTKDTANGLQQ